ncbi:MAG: adenylosuccinate synthase [Candidatus Diapherotrites archaeon]|nr:adenylosuccinate synthase [Candidatus Diapherotrites archaeon]
MPARIVIGAQYGDEGKGKIVDFFAEKAELVARFNGGNNAGHTVVVGKETFKFHLIPSGAVQGKECCICAGTAIDPAVMIEEISMIEKTGRKTKLSIDGRAQIIMPWHKQLDGASEQAKGKQKIGTTGRGIGPCYADRAARQGIRFCDFADKKRLDAKIKEIAPTKIKEIEKVYGLKSEFSVESTIKEFSKYSSELAKYLSDCSEKVNESIDAKKNVLLEGAQGTFLDNDFGTYPFVTSSHPLAGGALVGIGMGINRISYCTGVAKAYCTRVGSGPFITEIEGSLADQLRKKGAEFGTTTGRPRRIGWIDLPMLRTAHMWNNFTDLAITKLDVLSGQKEVKACISYKAGSKVFDKVPYDTEVLAKCKPEYKSFKGFELPPKISSFDDLPQEAIDFLRFVQGETSVPIKIISYGAERMQTLDLF